MPIDLLAACGSALYGPQWQSPLARDLGISDRTVRRWLAGTSEMPAGVLSELLQLLQARAVTLGNLAQQLRAVAV